MRRGVKRPPIPTRPTVGFSVGDLIGRLQQFHPDTPVMVRNIDERKQWWISCGRVYLEVVTNCVYIDTIEPPSYESPDGPFPIGEENN